MDTLRRRSRMGLPSSIIFICATVGILAHYNVAAQEEGQCKTFQASIIDGKQLVGDWYETHTTHGVMACIHMKIGILEDNSTLTWHYHWKDASNPDQKVPGIVGHARPGSTTNSFEIYSFDAAGQNSTIKVVGTQYNEFLILWQCNNENATHFMEEVFVFSRNTTLSNSVDGIIDLFSNSSKLHAVEQGDELCSKSPSMNLLNTFVLLLISLIVVLRK